MLPRSQRLTTTQFDRAFANSQTLRHPLVSMRVHFREDGDEITRAAFVVPKKQAKKASQRNLLRRRLRERYRLLTASGLETPRGYDLIFMSTPQTGGAVAPDLDAALRELLERAVKRIARENPRDGGQSGTHQATATAELPPVVTKESAPLSGAVSLPVQLALGAIGFYQRFISPGLPPSCRFEPTCSRYTYTSIERFGLVRGTFLGASRICKCHPWHEGGFDPVPQIFPDLLSKRPNKKKFSMRLFRSNGRDGASL